MECENANFILDFFEEKKNSQTAEAVENKDSTVRKKPCSYPN